MISELYVLHNTFIYTCIIMYYSEAMQLHVSFGHRFIMISSVYSTTLVIIQVELLFQQPEALKLSFQIIKYECPTCLYSYFHYSMHYFQYLDGLEKALNDYETKYGVTDRDMNSTCSTSSTDNISNYTLSLLTGLHRMMLYFNQVSFCEMRSCLHSVQMSECDVKIGHYCNSCTACRYQIASRKCMSDVIVSAFCFFIRYKRVWWRRRDNDLLRRSRSQI